VGGPFPHLVPADNSNPVATSFFANVTEDVCSPLPSFDDFITDWDNTGFLGRGQTLTVSITGLPSRGMLYSDSSCTAAVTEANVAGFAVASLYYKPIEHEYSFTGAGVETTTDGVYATMPWEVKDGASPTEGADSAVLSLRVEAVNDKPVAWDSSTPQAGGGSVSAVYMDIPYTLTMNGTDIDGADPANPIAECTTKITRVPLYGVLRQYNPLNPSVLGTTTLSVGDVVPNIYVSYQSNSFPDTAGQRIVKTDSFAFKLIDSSGAESDNEGAVSVYVLSGLDAISEYHDDVDEEVLKELKLRGINQRGGSTWFTVTQLPSHGTLYQCAAPGQCTGADQGAPIVSVPTNVSGAAVQACTDQAGYECASLGFQGAEDYFSFPTHTRENVALNVSDDSFAFVVESPQETSADGTVTLRINNVNDHPTITGPSNATFASGTATSVKVLQDVTIHDPDLGAGYYQVYVNTGVGTAGALDAPVNRQNPYSSLVDPRYWEGSYNHLYQYLDYCPIPCSLYGSCGNPSGRCIGCGDESACDWSAEGNLKVFATPRVAQEFIRNLAYFQTHHVNTNDEITIRITDLEDQRCTPDPNNAWKCRPTDAPGPPPPSGVVVVEKVVKLYPDNAFCEAWDASCSGASGGGCGGGLITMSIGWAIIGLSVVLWLFVCCRQRARTSVRDRRGRRKPRSQQASSDMRCLVPLLATMSYAIVVLGFLMRSAFSAHAIFRMDFWGDGYCGANATRYGGTPTPAEVVEAIDGVNGSGGGGGGGSSNSSFELRLTSADNLGCTGGIPEGFMITRMMGDMLILGIAGPLATIEVTGRPAGRCLVFLISFSVFLLAVIKFSIWEAFPDQVPEVRQGGPVFLTEYPSGHEKAGEVALGPCENDIRPFQNSFFILIMPMIMLPAMGNIGFILLCGFFNKLCRSRGGDGDDEDDDEEEDEDSEEEERRRRRRKKHRKAKEKEKEGRHHRGRHRDDDDDDDERRRERKHKHKKARGGDRAHEDEALWGDDDDEAPRPPPPSRPKPKSSPKSRAARDQEGKPPPPKGKPPKGKGGASEVRAPRIPGMARLRGGKGGADTEMVTIAVEGSSTTLGVAPVGPTVPVSAALSAPPPIEWFYMDSEDAQQGPVSEAQLRSLYNLGDIHDFTFIWNEGIPSWTALKDAGLQAPSAMHAAF
jgi:hypothetical protein